MNAIIQQYYGDKTLPDAPSCVSISERSKAEEWEYFLSAAPEVLSDGIYGADQIKVDVLLLDLERMKNATLGGVS